MLGRGFFSMYFSTGLGTHLYIEDEPSLVYARPWIFPYVFFFHFGDPPLHRGWAHECVCQPVSPCIFLYVFFLHFGDPPLRRVWAHARVCRVVDLSLCILLPFWGTTFALRVSPWTCKLSHGFFSINSSSGLGAHLCVEVEPMDVFVGQWIFL